MKKRCFGSFVFRVAYKIKEHTSPPPLSAVVFSENLYILQFLNLKIQNLIVISSRNFQILDHFGLGIFRLGILNQ